MRFYFGLLALVSVAACNTTTVTDQVPVSETPSHQYQPIRSSDRSNTRALAREYIQVVNRIEPVAESECRRRTRGVNCDFAIVVDDRPDQPPNAFQTVDESGQPYIIFTLSLLRETRNADEIAFVMAHEAAHHIHGHLLVQQRNARVGAEVFGELAGVLGAEGDDAIETAQEIGALVGAHRFSQEFELEADRLGTRITLQAGFDPIRGAEFFNHIPDPGDDFFSTHPPNDARIAAVHAEAGRR